MCVLTWRLLPVPPKFDTTADQVLVISQFSSDFVSEYRAAQIAIGELPAFPLKPHPGIENAYFLASEADVPAAQAAFAANEGRKRRATETT